MDEAKHQLGDIAKHAGGRLGMVAVGVTLAGMLLGGARYLVHAADAVDQVPPLKQEFAAHVAAEEKSRLLILQEIRATRVESRAGMRALDGKVEWLKTRSQ